jgi:type VI secretion system secreted protein Hcp
MPSSYFLKIDGIPGESLDSKHKDEIDVLSWSWGETQPAPANPGAGAGSGKVAITDLHVSTQM